MVTILKTGKKFIIIDGRKNKFKVITNRKQIKRLRKLESKFKSLK